MRTLGVDIETYSGVDLIKSGVYAYSQSPDFTVLLFGYAFDDDPVRVIDLTEDVLTKEILVALTDPNVIKTAFNANFEITCLSAYLDHQLQAKQWWCTAVHALTLGFPGSLAGVGSALRLPEDKQKDRQGKALITYFSKPCKPTRANGMRTRNLPIHDPAKWALYKAYNVQDVEVERTVRKKLERFPTPKMEHDLWVLDQQIISRGVKVDLALVERAMACDEAYQARINETACELTGLDNPKSVAQVKDWIETVEGIEVDNLRKENVPNLIKQVENEDVKALLEMRGELAKTSVKKYEAISRAVCPDGRVRGLLQFYGASRTGRWAGRLVQVQNLPQNHLPDLDNARELLKMGEFEGLEMIFDSVPDVLSQLIRTAFIPQDGSRFIVADFSAIEARVIAWLSGEQWRLDVFNSHGKIYEASAEKMFHLEPGSVKKGDPMRQKGKIAELALGYGGSVGALTAMGALKMGLEEEELKPLVDSWRKANPKIVAFWWAVDQAAKEAVRGGQVSLPLGLKFYCSAGILFIRLPSGRELAYVQPKIEPGPYDRDKLTYMGQNQTSKKWERIDTYGPKLVENIVQAASRDCLAVSMMRLKDYQIVFHVHDELILEVPKGQSSAEELSSIMGQPIEWAPGLPMRADAYECDYYMKD